MQKLILAALIMTVIVSGCAPQTVPNKRPLRQSALEQINSPVPLIMNIPARNGMGTTYFEKDSSMGFFFGLGGEIALATMDKIVNAGPKEIASVSATRVADIIDGEGLINHAYAALIKNKNIAPPNLNIIFNAPTHTEPKSIQNQKSIKPKGLNVQMSYRFKNDMSGFYVYAKVNLNIKGMVYTSPYKRSKQDNSGRIYENEFYYYSDQLDLPVKLQSEIDANVAEIKANSYKNGIAPRQGGLEQTVMANKIRRARQPYTLKEIADKLTNIWLANDGEKLRIEIEAAHEFIATQIYKDLARFDAPKFKGSDKVLETLENGRVIKILGNGINSGIVQSEPQNFVATGWGNSVMFSGAAQKPQEKHK